MNPYVALLEYRMTFWILSYSFAAVLARHWCFPMKAMLTYKPGSAVLQCDEAHALRVGFDLVQISRIEDSLAAFGTRFEERLFSQAERAYAHAGAGQCAQRLAARFAAKEAVIKALSLSDEGVNWRDIEVQRGTDGDCSVQLHGRAAEVAARRRLCQLLLSLSHDGDYAGAFVTAAFNPPVQRPDPCTP
jgi:holo-[acyl-carrier protein] synthase